MTIPDAQGNLHATDGKFAHKPASVDDDANQALQSVEDVYEDYPDVEDDYEESNVVFEETFDDRAFEVDRPDPDDDQYAVYEDGQQVAVFDCSGDPEDHDEIWSQALAAMKEAGAIRLCSDCREAPPEGDATVCASCY